MKHPNIKLEKINKLIQKRLSIILNEKLSNIRYNLITITRVIISNNLLKAKIFITALHNENNIIYTLNNSKKNLKYYLSLQIKLNKTPELIFINDNKTLKENKIQNLINTI